MIGFTRRAWAVIAAPPASHTASFLRVLIPVGAVLAAVNVFALPGVPIAKPVDVVWVYALLWVVRQRDEARTQNGPPQPRKMTLF